MRVKKYSYKRGGKTIQVKGHNRAGTKKRKTPRRRRTQGAVVALI